MAHNKFWYGYEWYGYEIFQMIHNVWTQVSLALHYLLQSDNAKHNPLKELLHPCIVDEEDADGLSYAW